MLSDSEIEKDYGVLLREDGTSLRLPRLAFKMQHPNCINLWSPKKPGIYIPVRSEIDLKEMAWYLMPNIRDSTPGLIFEMLDGIRQTAHHAPYA